MASKPKPTRLKALAARHPVPATREDAARAIREIGDLQRQHLRAKAEMNDAIAAITERWQPHLDALVEQVQMLQAGVQTWCEAHRDELTQAGRVKTANLVTGEVQWRQRPPSVRVTGAEAVIDTLERLGLAAFVRVKKEVNKEAILNDPAGVAGVAGIHINQGIEDFVITPFEQDLQPAS